MRREGKDSEKRRVRSTHRRRRKLARLLLGDPTEHALDYPGFFVLPRAISQRDPASGKRPTRRARWGSLKLAMLGLFTLVGFVGLLAYFFAHVEPARSRTHRIPSLMPLTQSIRSPTRILIRTGITPEVAEIDKASE
jgi:hypothetical protein